MDLLLHIPLISTNLTSIKQLGFWGFGVVGVVAAAAAIPIYLFILEVRGCVEVVYERVG
jgi:hypothetical protein